MMKIIITSDDNDITSDNNLHHSERYTHPQKINANFCLGIPPPARPRPVLIKGSRDHAAWV